MIDIQLHPIAADINGMFKTRAGCFQAIVLSRRGVRYTMLMAFSRFLLQCAYYTPYNRAMSYQVLARKYRPASFQDLEGQEHVLQALVNALDNQRLHHAYLFTGTRGVGKTTIARILARCLNCESGLTSVPCGECNTCLEISEGRSVDLHRGGCSVTDRCR